MFTYSFANYKKKKKKERTMSIFYIQAFDNGNIACP